MSNKPNYVPGIGPSNAKIAFIGEAPGAQEDKELKPFVGQAGSKLRELCRYAEIDLHSCYISNVVKYRPPDNDLKRLNEIGIDLLDQENKLRNELITLSPHIIVALGNTALTSLTGRKGISKFRGSILQALYGNFKVLPTYHPASLLYSESWKNKTESSYDTVIGGETLVIADLVKAKKNSLTRDFPNLNRTIEIIKSEYQLYKFLESYRDRNIVSIDIETHKGIPTCIALAFTPYHGVSVPLLSIPGYGGGLTLEHTEYISIWKTLSKFLNRLDIKFVGQNIKFDIEKLVCPSKLLSIDTRNKVHADTSLMMGVAYTEFPKNLAFMTSLLTNEPYYKDEGKEFNPKKDKAENLLIYNAKDALVTMEIKEALDKEFTDFSNLHPPHRLDQFYYSYINQLHDFYMDLESEGLDIDLERRNELVIYYTRLILEKKAELYSLVGREFKVRSNPEIRKIITQDLKLPHRESYGAEEITALIGNHTDLGSKESRILSLILEIRQIETNFNYLKVEPDPDGIMRTTTRITGAETGRASDGILEPPIRPIQTGWSFKTLPKHGPFSKLIRSIIVAPQNHILLQLDYSQAEARVVHLLANDYETLKLFDSSDFHSIVAGWIFNKDPKDIDYNTERFIGKKGKHAMAYGEGDKKLMLDVNMNAKKFGIPVQISQKTAKIIIETLHKKMPRIRSEYHNEVKRQIGRDRTLFNPFGRMRQFFGNVKDTECYAQIPQSTVPDALRLAALRAKKRNPKLRICIESHDALLLKSKEDEYEKDAKILREEMEKEIDFKNCSLSRGKLRIPVEIEVGKRYSELKKVGI